MSEQQDPDAVARFLLDFLVGNHPTLFSLDELVREYAGGPGDAPTTMAVAEGLAELAAAGLVNQVEGFFFASRAAIRAHQLAR
jgi:hypothetical protein